MIGFIKAYKAIFIIMKLVDVLLSIIVVGLIIGSNDEIEVKNNV